ncbi:putative FAD-linked oxidoreductase [Ralstonia psammae]|uniref:FAD-linked oxidoreductase n=1 Tax=Ralstonia psammae TaxID=3058598 RepID=A0ABN9IT04_9RALS|nr:FAD-binding oxidoreductase [Ralstonia sp. LMG 19083]CAJ0789400.1 putative FAD-linked oxidoreductase [Ralstonia sp. LMG 19083]
MTHHMEDLYAALADVLGEGGTVRDEDIVSAYAGDWSEAPKQSPRLVLLPQTPQQVAAALDVCSRFRQPVVVQGGLTGLAGGGTPRTGEIALSLSRLNRIEEIDAVGGIAVVQAGVVLEALQQRVEEHGWSFPLDLGARGSCQLGGNAAVNAGGNRVIRYGTMRAMVLGVEVALPNGTLLTMLNRVEKNTTGIDLKHLFIGSEGTLGVITRLVLKLSPKPTSSCTALCAMPSFSAAAQLLRRARMALPSLSAFEVMWADFMAAAIQVASLRQPFSVEAPVYVLIETQGANEEEERRQLEAFLGEALEAEAVMDVIVAQSLDGKDQLWQYRETVGELLAQMKPHAAFDVGIPMAAMETFVESTREVLTQRFPEQRHLFFGHIGDGNLHVLSGPHMTDENLHCVEDIVYTAVREVGGSISAEHGIGVIKKAFLHNSRSTEEISLMRSLKALLDPDSILNSGRIL